MNIHHPLTARDGATVAAIAEQSAPFKGMMNGPEARAGYDEMIAAVPAGVGVTTEASSLGGVSGYWLRPNASPNDAAILYLHGGGYVLGIGIGHRGHRRHAHEYGETEPRHD